MRSKLLLSVIGASLFASSALAQVQAPVRFTPEAFRAHVEFLGHDLLEGREAGTRGYDLAANYVASGFQALGLRGPVNGGYLQQISFMRYAAQGTPRLTVGGRSFAPPAFTSGAAPDTAAYEASNVEAVFVGHGVSAPELGLDDYRGLDVRGKVVVALSGLPDGMPSDVAAHLNAEKRRMAAARGAVGMIMVAGGGADAEAAFRRALAGGRRPGTAWTQTDGSAFTESHGLRFVASADNAVAEALFAGAPRTLAQLRQAYRARTNRPAGFTLTQRVGFAREAAQVSRFTSPNVVAVLPGSDPAVANEYVLLMAHLDGMGMATEGEGDRIRNGAMDNATGVSTLLEVARQMMASGQRPRRSILFAAVTAEEKGLLGAGYMARNPVVDGRIVGVVNLDMPILTYDFQDVIAFGAEHSTLREIVGRAAQGMNVALTPDPLPQESLFVRSDHYQFVKAGVPSVFLMTGFANGGRERFTGFLANEYHGPRDDLNLPFNWQAGARFAELNYRIAREIADGAEAPRWNAGSFFRPQAASAAAPTRSR